MNKIFTIVLLFLAIFVCGCGGEKTAEKISEKSAPVTSVPKTITGAEADAKIKELSAGLNVHVDDMKEVTFCHCPINYDIRPSIAILYVGREVLYSR